MVDLLSPTHGFCQSRVSQRRHQSQSRKRAAKGEKRLYHFPWFCCYSSFFSLTHLSCSAQIDCLSAVIRGSQAGEYHPQLLLPTAPCCSWSPRLTYNRIWMTTLGTGPAESHFSFPLPHLDPPWLRFCSCSRRCTCNVCSPSLFASPSTSPLPRAGHLGGHRDRSQRALTAHPSPGFASRSPFALWSSGAPPPQAASSYSTARSCHTVSIISSTVSRATLRAVSPQAWVLWVAMGWAMLGWDAAEKASLNTEKKITKK